jgi:hypothetical protein
MEKKKKIISEKVKNINRLTYMSYSKLRLWEQDKSLFYQVYVDGIEQYKTKALLLGKRMAETLEAGYDEEGDKDFERIAQLMPGYPLREFEINVKLENIPLKGFLDGFDMESFVMGEYKTGKKFTQAMVDKHDQLTFYALLVWLKYKKLPSRIYLHHAQTRETPDGRLELTGLVRTFKTRRTLADVIVFTNRIRRAWKGVCAMQSFITK